MRSLRQSLIVNSRSQPDKVALTGMSGSMTYAELRNNVDRVIEVLKHNNVKRLGLLCDNGFSWVIADLASIFSEIVLVPIPLFFSSRQILHSIKDAGLSALLIDKTLSISKLFHEDMLESIQFDAVDGLDLILLKGIPSSEVPEGTGKITYTSGTTGEPKGVCLSYEQIEKVAYALCTASESSSHDRHLCLTPLSTLLENIGGIYCPLMLGASVCVNPLRQVGLTGSNGFNAEMMAHSIMTSEASTIILAPQMLQSLVARVKESGLNFPKLRFIAVGGAPVSEDLLRQAHLVGLPVFEGYGMSECASVVSLNTPRSTRLGSAGHPLPHVSISFAEDGEIRVNGSGFLGYLGDDRPVQPIPTGDIGYMDEEGFLHITGRKKSIFINSFGRNVAPEWVEREFTLFPAIHQIAVFGESKPFNVAVVVQNPNSSSMDVRNAIEMVNRNLPDYAQIRDWVIADKAFSPSNLQLTANGRLKRDSILQAYSDLIEPLYKKESNVVF